MKYKLRKISIPTKDELESYIFTFAKNNNLEDYVKSISFEKEDLKRKENSKELPFMNYSPSKKTIGINYKEIIKMYKNAYDKDHNIPKEYSHSEYVDLYVKTTMIHENMHALQSQSLDHGIPIDLEFLLMLSNKMRYINPEDYHLFHDFYYEEYTAYTTALFLVTKQEFYRFANIEAKQYLNYYYAKKIIACYQNQETPITFALQNAIKLGIEIPKHIRQMLIYYNYSLIDDGNRVMYGRSLDNDTLNHINDIATRKLQTTNIYKDLNIDQNERC